MSPPWMRQCTSHLHPDCWDPLSRAIGGLEPFYSTDATEEPLLHQMWHLRGLFHACYRYHERLRLLLAAIVIATSDLSRTCRSQAIDFNPSIPCYDFNIAPSIAWEWIMSMT